MSRIGELDLPDRLSPMVPRWTTQIGVGVACTGGTILVRALLDAIAPGGAPFALIFPAIILATLFARWPAGAITAVLSILYAWYYKFPVYNSFRFANPAGELAVASIVIAAILTVVIAEAFRGAARHAMDERARDIADRDLLLAEFDHRMKNNFQIVASILDMQRRRSGPGDAADALAAALRRVDSIARAHRHLYRGTSDGQSVQMRDYLKDLCAALGDALLLRAGVTLNCTSDEAEVARDRAVSIGLIINELVTNAAKHAFAGRDRGAILVSFHADSGGGATLIVADDGIGMPSGETPAGVDHGLGSRLIPAFARQAGGAVHTSSSAHGTTVTLTIPA